MWGYLMPGQRRGWDWLRLVRDMGRRWGLGKARIGAECGALGTLLEKVAVEFPVQGGADIDGFKLMTQLHPFCTFSAEAKICRSGFPCFRGRNADYKVLIMYYLIYVI